MPNFLSGRARPGVESTQQAFPGGRNRKSFLLPDNLLRSPSVRDNPQILELPGVFLKRKVKTKSVVYEGAVLYILLGFLKPYHVLEIQSGSPKDNRVEIGGKGSHPLKKNGIL